MRSTKRLGALLFGLALGALAITGCGSGGGGPATISIRALRAAAEHSQTADTQTFEFTIDLRAKGEHASFGGGGVVATDGTVGRVSMKMGSLGSIEELVTPDGFYLDLSQLPGASEALPEGKHWVLMTYQELADQSGQDLKSLIEQQQQNSSTHALDQLRAASGEVETIGPETVHGAPAIHYRTKLDYAALADSTEGLSDAQARAMKKLGRVPMDVWIDDQDRVVKMVFAMGGTALGDADASMTMTMEITAFGEPLDVVAPPADETMSMSEFKALRDSVGA